MEVTMTSRKPPHTHPAAPEAGMNDVVVLLIHFYTFADSAMRRAYLMTVSSLHALLSNRTRKTVKVDSDGEDYHPSVARVTVSSRYKPFHLRSCQIRSCLSVCHMLSWFVDTDFPCWGYYRTGQVRKVAKSTRATKMIWRWAHNWSMSKSHCEPYCQIYPLARTFCFDHGLSLKANPVCVLF